MPNSLCFHTHSGLVPRVYRTSPLFSITFRLCSFMFQVTLFMLSDGSLSPCWRARAVVPGAGIRQIPRRLRHPGTILPGQEVGRGTGPPAQPSPWATIIAYNAEIVKRSLTEVQDGGHRPPLQLCESMPDGLEADVAATFRSPGDGDREWRAEARHYEIW